MKMFMENCFIGKLEYIDYGIPHFTTTPPPEQKKCRSAQNFSG